MEGLVGDLTHASSVAPSGTSSQDLVVVVVDVTVDVAVDVALDVATCPFASYKEKFGGSSRDLQRRESCFLTKQ
jgi:hypothetical protein